MEECIKSSMKKFDILNVRALKYYLISTLSIVGFILIWQILVKTGLVSQRILASPDQVFEAFIFKLQNKNPDGATLPQHFAASILIVVFGYVTAAFFGVTLGLLMGWFKIFEGLVNPIFELIRPVPPIAWIPLSILWFGIGLPAKSFIIFLTAFVPCVLNSYTGIKQTKQVLIDAARTFGASNFEIFLKVGIPSSLMMVFTGLKVSLSASWMAVVAAELLGSTRGLGYMIQMSRNFGRPDIIIVGMLTIGLIGSLLAMGLDKLEEKLDTSRNFNGS